MTGDRKKLSTPVIQNIWRYVNARLELIPKSQENIALGHRIHIGHCSQQEQKELREFSQVIMYCVCRCVRSIGLGVLVGNQGPYDPRGQHHRLRLPEVRELLRDNKRVGHNEQHNRNQAYPVRGQVHKPVSPLKVRYSTGCSMQRNINGEETEA